MSIGAHLADRNYSLRFLDSAGAPAFRQSPSAPDPEAEEYTGASGLQSIAESLAAIQLSGPHHAHLHRNRAHGPRPQPGGIPGQEAARSGEASGSMPQAFGDALLDKLSAHRLRGPILAVLGSLTPAEARALSPAAAFGANAFALLVTDQSDDSGEVSGALEALRLGGWRAVAVSARTSLPDAWAAFDQADPAMAAAADVRRGAGGRP
jgi:hypothetical protein